MGFYEQISKYYDYIFPVGRSQVEFIKDSAGSAPKRILDVACGSGGYSIELAKGGYEVTAVDLDYKMIELAREKALRENVQISAFQCDMMELDKINDRENSNADYDLVFCIGNSLVHLNSMSEITGTLRQMHVLLSRSGTLLLQIINYDRVISNKVNELPIIANDEQGLKFIRMYKLNEEKGTISFNTVLEIDGKDQKERYENSIELLPVLSTDMQKALREAGFDKIELYGDFEYSSFDQNSYMLVIKAFK